jgi:hypothetical protein
MYIFSAVGLRNVSENFGLKILNNLNSVISMLEECVPPNLIPIKFTELSAEKHCEGILFAASVTVYPLL